MRILIIIGAVVVLGLMGSFLFLGVIKVEGSEVCVLQSLTKGVVSNVWLSGTHFYNNVLWDVYKYNIGTQKCTFDDNKNEGAEYPRIVVDCGDNGGQKAYIAMSINYRIGWDDDKGISVFSSDKIVKLHKDGIGKTYEDVIVKRTVIDVVNKIARPNQALSIYSGQGFVDFKEAVDKELKNHPVFNERGIYVENTIIYKVYLDSAYEDEIAAKQLAIQQKLRKIEEVKAAEEEARRVFAESQASVEKTRQQAEAAKIQMIKAAEANKAQEVLRAEAEKQKRILEAEGNRDANLANASGVLALGKAEAEVQQLKRDAMYAGEAGMRRANVEIADLTSQRLKGMFQGVSIVPEKTILSTAKGVQGLVVNLDDKNN